MHLLATLEFPPIGHLVEWKSFLLPGFNKVALICVVATILTLLLFRVAGRQAQLVPTGVQNIVESIVEFVREGIIMQTMGPEGLSWLPFLTSLFCFIFFANIFEVIPFIQFPAPARMAIPLSLALLVWVLFNYMGIKSQGFVGYMKSSLFPPGVPKALYLLVTPIEFLSTFLVRPFSLAVRLFANELAGHLLLVTFAVLSAALFTKTFLVVILPLPAVMLVLLTGFEVLVAVLQAFIFTILTAVYIGGAMHPEH
ncbi:MAG: F-type H+-transporting ATPase subunit a [Actinomycetota bacterium]|nr:F-type H+-transporting ATPase subunit a [Actinomycetota bacterium]